MRIVLLGNAASIHTVKWVNGLVSRGHEVHLVSQDEAAEHRIDDRVVQHRLPHTGTLGYFRNARPLSRMLARIRPEVVNAHYATGYGTTMRMAHPDAATVLNVWGSDVYDFPNTSPLHRFLVVSNLRYPTRLASTSRSMAAATASLAKGRTMDITPFGVDPDLFSPPAVDPRPNGVIGTVKKLDSKYGIDTLIHAFALVKHPVRLVIAGTGPQEEELKNLVAKLKITDRVEFLGAIPNTEVPELLGGLDVYVALSRLDSESFGVAIVEAAACGCPTVVSDVSGPAEVVEDKVTEIIVPRDNPVEAAKALDQLLGDPEVAQEMGRAGRRHVVENYSWEHCLEVMEEVYIRAIAGERN